MRRPRPVVPSSSRSYGAPSTRATGPRLGDQRTGLGFKGVESLFHRGRAARRQLVNGAQSRRIGEKAGHPVARPSADAGDPTGDPQQRLAFLQPILGTLALGDVVGEGEPRRPSAEADRARRHFDVDQSPVLPAVLPDTDALRRIAEPGQSLVERNLGVRPPDVADRHRQKLGLRVAVVRDRGVVDGEEAQGLGVVDPHRQRVRGEHQPVLRLGGPQLFGGGMRCITTPSHSAMICKVPTSILREGMGPARNHLQRADDGVAGAQRHGHDRPRSDVAATPGD